MIKLCYSKIRKTFLLLLIYGFISNANFVLAQKIPQKLISAESNLNRSFILLKNGLDDAQKNEANEKIILEFKKTLLIPESFEYPFDSLKNMGKLTAPDKSFRIYNWNIQHTNGEFTYYAFIQYKIRKDEFVITQLTDVSETIKNPIDVVCTYDKWFGALYYDIIGIKNGKNQYYTLLGWDGNNDFTNKKIIDVIYFSRSGKPKFGKSIFKLNKRKQKRVIFEYSYRTTMMLRYDKKFKMIVFDHLAPSSSNLQGNYQYYGSDFSYDGLFYKNGRWNFVSKIDLKNPKKKQKNKKKISTTF